MPFRCFDFSTYCTYLSLEEVVANLPDKSSQEVEIWYVELVRVIDVSLMGLTFYQHYTFLKPRKRFSQSVFVLFKNLLLTDLSSKLSWEVEYQYVRGRRCSEAGNISSHLYPPVPQLLIKKNHRRVLFFFSF